MENQTFEEQFDNNSNGFQPWGMDLKSFCMLMHLSQLASFIIPVAGLALPIIMWATNKDKSPQVDAHGKNILNWMITLFIAYIIGFILIFILIGFVVLLALVVTNIIFAIIGAIKANDGVLFKYPFAIQFIK